MPVLPFDILKLYDSNIVKTNSQLLSYQFEKAGWCKKTSVYYKAYLVTLNIDRNTYINI